jgi:outer membrane lipoprotein-sorting protein
MKKALIFLIGVSLSLPSLAQLSAKEIVQRSEDNLRGNSNMTELEIRIIRPNWQRTMEAKSWAKGTEKSMVLILSPARDKGTVFLKRNKEIWNYIPTVERNIKLPPSMMMQSWMGTDFNNDDLVRESSMVNDYTHQLLGEETIEGLACHKIEFIPKPDAPVVWGKIMCFISKTDYLQMRVEFYDEEGTLINVMQGFDVTQIGGRTLPARMRMVPQDKEGHYTEMIYRDIAFDIDIADSFFTTQNMKRVR